MTEYKDRERLEFKGLTWRYSKYYGHWTPVEKENLLGFELPTIFSKDVGWYIVGWGSADTPLGALENWCKSCIQFDEREAADFRRQLYASEQSLVKLQAESWKVRGTRKKAKKASKKKGKKK